MGLVTTHLITDAYTSALSPCVPWDDGATIWVVAFSAVAEAGSGDPNTLQVFRSANGGTTWSAAGGGTKAVYTSDDLDNPICTRIQVRAHPDWPTQPYLYCMYLATAAALHVSRYNTVSQTWDLESGGDPEVVLRHPDGRTNEPVWSFDLQAGDEGAALINLDGDDVSGNYYHRVSRAGLDKSSLGWTAPERVDGQTGARDYTVGDVIRGDSAIGIHGWWGHNGVGFESYQAIIAEPDGSFLNIVDPATVADYIYGADWRIDVPKVQLVALNARAGTSETAIVAGESAPAVAWSGVFDAAGSGFGWPIAFARRDAFLDVFFAWPPPATDIYVREFDGTSLGAAESLHDGEQTIGPIGAGTVGPGAGCVFSLQAGDAALPLYFLSTGTSAQIVGGAGITSAEAFGQTHGVIGGGSPEVCGPGTFEPPTPGCGSGPSIPTYPGPSQCDAVGLAF